MNTGTGRTHKEKNLPRMSASVAKPQLLTMRVARGSASLLPSHGRGIWPRDVLKKVSRGLSRPICN